ncbi:extracellular calcium-sensing receptor [Xenopus tropicalis]|uniref:Extracellular calcium-sensing receptor n=1 Tax=Xenopus tropicalis TaxID=8364 RepID=A0A8J1J8C7_XENTR|nr:extracellular calcium-sensing receptor [Xenopus tropicalis]
MIGMKELRGMSQPGDIVIGAVVPVHVDKMYPATIFTETPSSAICKTFRFENYQRIQALRFAVEEINKDPDLLPNITIGYQILDSCTVLQRALSGTLQLLTGHKEPVPNYRCQQAMPLAAIIGHSISTYSMMLAHILGLYRYPQISHFSTSSLLSDRTQFHSFFRTVPSDAFQCQGLAQLVLHFGWTWVGLVALDNDYGQQGIQMIKRDLLNAGACVAFTENIILNQQNRNAPQIARVIKESAAKVVVFFSTDIDLLFVLDEMLRQNISEKILVASEAWATSAFLAEDKYSKILSGTIGFALHSGTIPGFKDFLNSIHFSLSLDDELLKIFWEQAFGCQFQDQANATVTSEYSVKICTGSEDLGNIQNSYNDVSSLRVTYNVYTAVRVVAKALHDLSRCNDGEGPFCKGTCAYIGRFEPWQLLHYMKQVRLKTGSGTEFAFHENGDPTAVYDIINWQFSPLGKIQQVKVGSYDTGATAGDIFTVNISALHWSTGQKEQGLFLIVNSALQVPRSICSQSCPPGYSKAVLPGKPVCCFECFPCPHGEISNKTDSPYCFKCPWDMWPNIKRDSCLPKPREFLSYEDSLGETLATTSISSSLVPFAILVLFVHYKITPIVRANNYLLSCLLLVSLSLCFLCSLFFIGFPHPEMCRLRQVTFGMVFALCISCILAKTFMVVVAFKATKPNSSLKKWTRPRISYLIVVLCILIQTCLCTMWLLLSPPFFEENIRTKVGVVIVECNDGSSVAFWCMLGYLGLLASVSFFVAFLARRLPDSFNEAKFITFSMGTFLSVWISFIPATMSARGKYIVAMEIFAILSSTWALVVCMFVPKCFIILFRPNMNSREHLMGKEKRGSEKQACKQNNTTGRH